MIKRLLLGGSATAMVAILAVALIVDFSPTPLSESQPDEVAQDESSGGPNEGIEVHGHWVIEVREPDGSLVDRREFQNDLVYGGQTALAGLLRGAMTYSGWTVIIFDHTSQAHPCVSNSGQAVACRITVPEDPSLASGEPFYFGNLTVERGTTTTVVLSGTATAANPATINAVTTRIHVSDFITSTPFTESVAAAANWTPVLVQPNQSIAVTVTLSFS